MSTAAELLTQAVACHRAGRLPDAVPLYERVLAVEAFDAQGYFLRGVAYQNLGHADEAIASLALAVRLDPEHAEAHNRLGAVLGQQGKLDEAILCFQHALLVTTHSSEIWDNLQNALALRSNIAGQAHAAAGRLAAAVACFRHAVACQPAFAEAHLNLGTALDQQEHLDEAVRCQRRAIELKPNFAEAHNNLGAALVRQEQLDEAVACLRRALELKAGYFKAHNNLGAALAKLGRLEEAEASCRQAIELRPDFAEAYNTLATILEKLDRSDEAIATWRHALQAKPDFAAASNNLAAYLARVDRIEEAKTCYEQAAERDPERPLWKLNLLALCPTVFESNRAIDAYRRSLEAGLDNLASTQPRFDPEALAASSFVPSFNLQFQGRDERPIREAFARILQNSFPDETPPGATWRPRIGFVVTETHEQAFLKSMAGVLTRLDREQFDLVVVAARSGADTLRNALAGAGVSVLDVPNRLESWAAALRAARMDLLYYWEVGTDSINYLLPFFRLAPVQCTSWGIQVTSGIPRLDHYLSSALAEPEDAPDHYCENLVLAETLLTCRPRATLPAAPKTREFFGIAPGRHVYLCAQQLGKLQPDFDPILAEILRRDPAGEIVLIEDRQGRVAADQLRGRFAAHLGDVAGQIRFLPFQPTAEHLSLVAAADVLLDPVHFGGVNSTYDGFSLNQPIVTLPSRFQRGRYTLACYRKMGLTDCVARDGEHYAELAVALATQAEFRAGVVAKIRHASGALFEDGQAVTEHERIFSRLVEASRAARRPVQS